MGITVAYFLLKTGLYSVVNHVFFDGKRNQQWIKALLFIISVEGVLVFPAVVFGAYFELDTESVMYYVIFAVIIVKMMTIYKCYIIFFRRNVVHLQIILYFCTLEMIPLLVYWDVLVITANNLKINF
jgi:hypothetical protein